MSGVKTYLTDFFELFFPNFCICCNTKLFKGENFICTKCFYDLPKTNYINQKDNPVSELFWGRIKINHASSFYFFEKAGKIQQIIHQFKYKTHKEIGFELGKKIGHELLLSNFYKDIDLIIPVPLHKQKKRIRGYNQSEWFGKGISEVLNIPLDASCLLRRIPSSTQTKKTRIERWQNVENIFVLKSIKNIVGKHILLIDDIVTTGATLEACAIELYKADNVTISIVTIAVA